MMETGKTRGGVPIYGTIDGVDVVLLVDLLDHLFGDEWPSHEETYRVSDEWERENRAHGYEAPRDLFSMGVAAKQARDRGKDLVVVNDLS